MVVAGRAVMSPDPDPEARRQLRLRHEASATVVRQYLEAGFDAVFTDSITGAALAGWFDTMPAADRHLMVLWPSTERIAERELARSGASCSATRVRGSVAHRVLAHAPRRRAQRRARTGRRLGEENLAYLRQARSRPAAS